MPPLLSWARVDKDIPFEIKEALHRLHNQGYDAYLVGGALRNLLLGQLPKDWDIATAAWPGKVEELFPRTTPLGKRFGTIQVHMDDYTVEITTFRQEGPYSQGRHPDTVEFIPSITEDLSRRDFTMNAMALDPLRRLWVDPFGGEKDLKRGLVRAVGDPWERFQEDPLRMLRFFRFQAQLGFRGEKRTYQAVDPGPVHRISQERIRDEMDRLLLAPHPDKGLWGLYNTGLLTTLFPEFKPLEEEDRIIHHIIKTVAAIKPKTHLRWAALLHDLGKGPTRAIQEGRLTFHGHEKVSQEQGLTILQRLHQPKALQEKVERLVAMHMFPANPHQSDAALRRFIQKVGPENITDLLELRRADIVATSHRFDLAYKPFKAFCNRIEEILSQEQAFSIKDLAINGKEVMETLKISPGPRVGAILEDTLHWVLENPKRNNREDLLNYIRQKKSCNS